MKPEFKIDTINLNEKIAYQCSPVLLGVKTANTLTIPQSELEGTLSLLDKTGLLVLKLCECKKKSVILVYRDELLQSHLKKEQEQY